VWFGRQRCGGHVDCHVHPGRRDERALQLGGVVEQAPLARVGDRQGVSAVLALAISPSPGWVSTCVAPVAERSPPT
jgi:hypothetical protein